MASINIYEADYTNSLEYSPTETVVYIPGMMGCVDGVRKDAGKLLSKPTLVENLTDFETLFGKEPNKISTDPEVENVEYDKSFVMAKQLVAMGVKVLYEVVAKSGSKNKVEALTEVEMVTALTDTKHWDKLKDRSLYNPRFLTTGGYNAVRSITPAGAEPMAQAVIDAAAQRGDCVAIIDIPKGMPDAESINAIINGDGSQTSSPFTRNLSNGTYGAITVPWAKFALSVNLGDNVKGDIKEEVGGKEVYYWALPGSFAYLLSYTNMLDTFDSWFAAAGVTRGLIPLLVEPLVEIGEISGADLQSRKEGMVSVNPITYINPYGYRIYGNRTLRQNIESLKAQSFLNIRNLASDIKKTAYQACRSLQFEQNTDILWVNLRSKVSPILEKMLSGQGIRGYKLTRVKTEDRAKVVAKIRIIPIEAVEDFEITLELADSLEIETEKE